MGQYEDEFDDEVGADAEAEAAAEGFGATDLPIASWAKLPSGEWGVSIAASAGVGEGDEVMTETKGGKRTRVVLGPQAGRRGGFLIFEKSEAKPKGAPSPRREAQPVKNGEQKAAPKTIHVVSDERARQNAEVLWNGGIDQTGDLSEGEVGKKVWPLDDEQKRISLWRPHMGNVRVLAAAGSGKTRTTVALVSRLIWDGVLAPSQIVVTTFTAKAARELEARFSPVLSKSAFEALRLGTFHSLASRVAKVNPWIKAHLPGKSLMPKWKPRKIFKQILDEVYRSDSEAGYVMGTSRKSLGPALRELSEKGEPADVGAYMTTIDCARSAPGDDAMVLERLRAPGRNGAAVQHFPMIDTAWEIYCEAKRGIGEYDFADWLTWWELALAKGEDKSSAKLIIVDEAQDNNLIQFSIAQMLARNGQGNVILVGDVRQSIYAWRGANPEIMIEAEDTLGASTMEITTNYRSGKSIVALGNAIAEGKDYAVGRPSNPSPYAGPGLVTITAAEDVVGEGEIAANRITEWLAAHPWNGPKEENPGYKNFAILGRTRAQGGAAEATLVAAGIPCAVVGGSSFFKREEVQATTGWIKALSGLPVTADEVNRVLHYPVTGLGKAHAEKIVGYMARGNTFAEAADMATTGNRGEWLRKASTFAEWAQEIEAASRSAEDESAETRWVRMLDELAAFFRRHLDKDEDEEEIIDEDGEEESDPALVAINVAKSRPGPAAFLQFAAQCADETIEIDEKAIQSELPPGRVVISTIHKAKGLEWPVVFVSASQDQFPHKRSDNVPEEERCFYVAVTRAKAECHLTYAEEVNNKPAGPSPFLRYAEPFVVGAAEGERIKLAGWDRE